MLKTLPDYEHLDPLTRISPSRFFLTRDCSLRGVWQSNGRSTVLPVPPAARLGSVIHSIFDRACSGCLSASDVDSVWYDEVSRTERKMYEENENHLVPLHKSARGYEIKRLNTITKVRQLATEQVVVCKVCTATNQTSRSEVWLESSDGLLGGYVDQIVQQSNGVEIVDYKSGMITEQNSDDIKESYKIQLLLYAGLYFENHGEWPVQLTLSNLDGSEYNVPMDSEESTALLDKSRAKIREINTYISEGATTEDLASPSPAACYFCEYRPVCKKYWKTRRHTSDWPDDVSGKVDNVTGLGNGTLIVNLTTNKDSLYGDYPRIALRFSAKMYLPL